MQVFLTVDVEAHRVIDEISGTQHDSLQCLLSSLIETGLPATFFVDLCEVATWGRPFMQRVCERIREAGQDLQLHAHPHHFTKDSNRWLLSDYTRADQEHVLDFALEAYRDITGNKPVAFRAGGFGIDANTFAILRERGIELDCSLMQGWKGCNVVQDPIGAPSSIHGMSELPMTPVVTLGTRSRPIRISSIDFNWLPLFVLKRALRSLRKDVAPAAIILLHSSSVMARVDQVNFEYRERLAKKFVQLVHFLKEESFEVQTIGEAARRKDLWKQPYPSPALYVETNILVQYWILLFQSYVGQGFKPKFRAFLIGNILFWVALAGILFKVLA